ncbi:hypothetical protein [Tenacibaculum sp. M341]|uniref:hypothetical protein n=1 Tax=Tenacibaculum sp. M341 TaxID=2530339 RepID=UPI00104AFE86|nr:hypothetical protein [Tenacibaculum sp. M341]TCI91386.1 hypothetical protein EYW44_10540 [Tenacibaculum sp. M341]
MLNQSSQKLHQNSSNLYISIFDENGKLQTQRLLRLKKGIGSGSIKVDSTFINKNYFIKASTKWMKNFNEDNSYVQRIKIIDNLSSISQTTTKNNIDFQILPEGGHFLADAINSVGIVVKDSNNKGIKIASGKITDSQNKIIGNFSTNHLGYGKSVFSIKKNEEYTLEITLDDGSTVSKKVNDVKQTGILLSVNNQNGRFTKVKLTSNQATVDKLHGKIYKTLIHNTNSYRKNLLEISNTKKEYAFVIENELLQPGTNIITLFNENNMPVAERVFFTYNKSLFTDVNLNHTITENDSISVSIFKKDVKDSTNLYLSASILPLKTKSYKPKNSIYSKFLITPYIKGDVANPSYYFENCNRRKLFELDLLLLTQGWSKYDWNNIYGNPPKEIHSFERGITVKGTLNSYDKKKHENIFLSSKRNNVYLPSIIDNGKFSFENVFLNDSTDIQLFLSSKRKTSKIKGVVQFFPKSFSEITPKISLNEYTDKNVDANLKFDKFIFDESNLLDEIEVKVKRTFNNTPTFTRGIISDKIKVDDFDTSLKNINILTFLRQQGFRIRKTSTGYTIESNRDNILEDIITRVYLDDAIIYGQVNQNLDLIEFNWVKDFEEIFISKAFGGEIFLYTKKTFKGNTNNKRYSSYKVPFGFMTEKKYYQPLYASTQNKIFYNYGAIHWEPNIIIDKNKPASYKFNPLDQEKVKIYIEGINDKGQLLSKEIILDLKSLN